MQVDDLRVVMSLGRTLSFSKTAEELFVSQSTVSRCVSRVEAELGQRLFERDTHSVALTAAGKFALESADTIVGAYDALTRRMAEFARGEHGSIRFAEIYYAMDRYLSEPLAKFATDYPDVDVSVLPTRPSVVEEAVVSSKADLGFSICCGEPPARSGVSWARYAEEGFIALMPKGHELAARKVVAEEDLEGQLLAFPVGEEETERIMLSHFGELGIRPAGIARYVIDHYGADILAKGAVTFIPECMADYPHRGLALRPFVTSLRATYFFLWRDDCRNPSIGLFLRSLGLETAGA